MIPEGPSERKTTQVFENFESKLRIEVGCRGKDLEVIDKEVTTGTIGMKLFLTEETMLKASPKERTHILWIIHRICPFNKRKHFFSFF